MYKTQNDLPLTVRESSAELLNVRLAEAIDLATRAKHAHWNVKGPNFAALHELFDRLADHLHEQADSLAERITALGGVAYGTLTSITRASNLDPYPQDARGWQQHVSAVATGLAQYGAKVRAGIDETARAGDAGTSDLLTGISRESDKNLWLLEAHLQQT